MKRLASLFALVCMMVIFSNAQSPVKLWSAPYELDVYNAKETGFSWDSKYYAIGDEKGKVTIYETATGNIYAVHQFHNSRVNCTIFQPYGNLLASSDKDGKIILYDVTKKELKNSISAHDDAINALIFSRDGRRIYSGGADKIVKSWYASTGKLISTIYGIEGKVLSLRATDDDKTLVVGTSNIYKGLHYYEIASGNRSMTIESANLQSLDLSPDNKCVATANLGKKIGVWDVNSGQLKSNIEGHSKYVNFVVFSPDGKFLISSSNDKTVKLWDFEKQAILYSIPGDKTYQGLAISPNGKYLATMDEKPILSIWDVSMFIPETNPASSYTSANEVKETLLNPFVKTTAVAAAVKINTPTGTIVKDIDGNEYETFKIGDQIWMGKDLRTTKFNDGKDIPLVTDTTEWKGLSTPGYCWYENDESTYGSTYGAMYNWYTVKTGKLCPKGWHVPSDAELTILINNLGGLEEAGGKLKETGTKHWESMFGIVTNESGLSVLPSGYRYKDGHFDFMGVYNAWWTTTENDTEKEKAWFYGLNMYDNRVLRLDSEKQEGLPVRCLSD